MASSQQKSKKRIPRSLSRQRTTRNNKQNRRINSNKSTLELKKLEESIKSQSKLREYALQTENQEMYAYSNKILLILLVNLAAKKTDESIKLANKYSKKTGISIPNLNLQSRVPSPKTTVKQIKNSYYHPSSGSMAQGWVWK